MTTTLVPDTGTDRHAIARGLLEVDVLDYEAKLWRELADFLAEPLALHNLLAQARREILAGIFDEPRQPLGVITVDRPITEKQAIMIREAATKVGWEFDEPEPILADVAPRRGGEHRRKDQPSWLQRLRDAWADETGDRDEVRL